MARLSVGHSRGLCSTASLCAAFKEPRRGSLLGTELLKRLTDVAAYTGIRLHLPDPRLARGVWAACSAPDEHQLSCRATAQKIM